MKTPVTEYVEKLCKEKHAEASHCDISSSRIHMVNTPIPTELYNQLEVMAEEYKRDINCLAGDFLTMALEEAFAHIPKQEQDYLDESMHMHQKAHFSYQQGHCSFDAGGS